MKRIRLHSGPWNGKVIEDSGAVRICLGIATKWEGNRPAVGARVGNAVYEPDADRKHAHWSHNEWDGICIYTVEGGQGE